MALVRVLLVTLLLQASCSSLRGVDDELPPMVHDPVNHSDAFYNIIRCHSGVACHGTWQNGTGACDGTLRCGDATEKQGSSDEMYDLGRSSRSLKNLIVCRHGAYCPGGLRWVRGGGLVCLGGVICRPAPSFSEVNETALEKKWFGPSHWMCRRGACGKQLLPKELPDNNTIQLVTGAMHDPVNSSDAVENLISCRFGVDCNGTWTTKNGARACDGALVCTGKEKGSAVEEMYDLQMSSHSFKNLIICRYGSYCPGGWHWSRGRRVCKGGLDCFMTPVLLGLNENHTVELTKWWSYSHWICQTGRCGTP